MRDKKTGKTKGFCFLAYEDQRSTVLAVDNLNGFKVQLQVKFNLPSRCGHYSIALQLLHKH